MPTRRIRVSVLDPTLRRHWAALVALAVILAATLVLARWESGTSVAATSPADGKVIAAGFDVGADGTSYAVWLPKDGDGLQVATGRGTELGEPRAVPLPGAAYQWVSPRVAAARDSALVALRAGGEPGSVIALRVSRDGTVAGPITVSTTPATGQFLEVETADDGSGVIAWESDSPLESETAPPTLVNTLHAVAVDAGLGVGPEQSLTDNAGPGPLSLTVAPDGRAALAWAQPGAPVGPGLRAGGRVAVVEAAPGASFGMPAYAPDAAGGPALGNAVTVAYTREGDLRVAWVEQRGSGDTEVDSGVTARGGSGGFRDRIVLAQNALPGPPSLVPLAGGELVGFDRAGPTGYLPEDRAWHDVFAVSGARVLAHDSLASRGHNGNNDPVTPLVVPAGSRALAVWAAQDDIAWAPCSAKGCAEPRGVATAGRREEVQYVGIAQHAIAWLEGRYDSGYEFRVGELD
jgi:hypothetical protein